MAEKKVQKRVPGYKSENQKYKSLLVMQYNLKNADDEHAVTIGQIEDHLAKYGIEAERRSIYRDIHAMMDLMNLEQDPDNEITDRERLGYQIVHTRKPHKDAPNGGYLVTARPYKFVLLLSQPCPKRKMWTNVDENFLSTKFGQKSGFQRTKKCS